MVFVDTSAWFAKFVPDDPDHARLEAWFNSTPEPLVTTDYCVDETLTLLVVRKRLARVLVAGRALFDPRVTRIHFISQNQVERAWILFQQRAAAGWSFTDCTSKIVIDDLGINAAASLDIHFQQFGITVVKYRVKKKHQRRHFGQEPKGGHGAAGRSPPFPLAAPFTRRGGAAR